MQKSVSRLLQKVHAEDYEAVLKLGTQLLTQLSPTVDPGTAWLVQEALCSAAHEADDYEFMDALATELTHTANLLQRADLHVEALCKSSTAKRCLGQTQAALEMASKARKQSTNFPAESPLRVQVYQVLIAALVESGDFGQAWQLHGQLDECLHLVIDSHEQGKAYWTLGNLAFMVNQPQLGLYYHDRAATLLSPAKDMLLWARFNRASTEMRLQAGIADSATHDCLQRAETAFELIEAGDLDRMGLRMTQSRLAALDGDSERATVLLEDFTAHYSGSGEHLVPLYQWWADLAASTGRQSVARDKQQYVAHWTHQQTSTQGGARDGEY